MWTLRNRWVTRWFRWKVKRGWRGGIWQILVVMFLMDTSQGPGSYRIHGCMVYLGGGNSNILLFSSHWGRFPFWRAYFSSGLKPPISENLRSYRCTWRYPMVIPIIPQAVSRCFCHSIPFSPFEFSRDLIVTLLKVKRFRRRLKLCQEWSSVGGKQRNMQFRYCNTSFLDCW